MDDKECFLSYVGQHGTKSGNCPFICDLHSPETYKCQKCHFQSDLKVFLTKHFDTVHRRKETQHDPTPDLRYCENCDFQTYSFLVLLSHNSYCSRSGLAAKDKNSVENVKEEQNSNQRNENLKVHLLQKHTPADQINWFKCEHCPHRAKWKHKLRRHMLTKHSQPAELEKLKRFKCDQCPYKTIVTSNLKEHILWMHTSPDEINWLQCEHCSHKTRTKQKLREHMIAKHSKPAELEKLKCFKCDQCPYKTRRSYNLRVHILHRHTPSEQIDWHKCDQCPYKTKRSEVLREHMQQMHAPSEQINWFKCDLCSFKSKRKRNVHRHMLSRHAETPQPKEQRAQVL